MYISRYKIKTKTLRPLLAVLALILIVSASVHPVVSANDITPGKVLKLTNESRVKAGLAALTQNEALSAAAAAKAKDMVVHDYFAHTSPAGVSPWHWMDSAGYQYRYAGENLAINYGSAQHEQEAWMKSPTHRANILNTHYTEVGIATLEGKIDGESAFVTVVMFGTPKVVVPPPVTETEPEPATVPETVKGISDEALPVPLETSEPELPPATAPGHPALNGLWNFDNQSTLVWMGIFELILVISALYFFYKDAIEYVALERGLRLAVDGGGSLPLVDTTDSALDQASKPPLVARLE